MIIYINIKLSQEIRGSGLAYGALIHHSIADNKLTLDLFKASKMKEAFIMAEEIIKNHVENDNEWDANLVDSAKGQLIHDLIAYEAVPQSLASTSFDNYMLGRDVFYNRNLVNSARKVTLPAMIKMAREFLPFLLKTDVAQTAIVCNPSKVQSIVQSFKRIGVNLTSYDSIDAIFV